MESEKISVYIDVLSDTIRTVVAPNRENVHRWELNFECLAHFEKAEDEANRKRCVQELSTQTSNPNSDEEDQHHLTPRGCSRRDAFYSTVDGTVKR